MAVVGAWKKQDSDKPNQGVTHVTRINPYLPKELAMNQMSFVFGPAAAKLRCAKHLDLQTFVREEEVECVQEATSSGGTRRRKLPRSKAAAAARYAGTGLVCGL
jgi:hypothetical protein